MGSHAIKVLTFIDPTIREGGVESCDAPCVWMYGIVTDVPPLPNFDKMPMTFAYDYDSLNLYLQDMLKKNLSQEAWRWLGEEGQYARTGKDVRKFSIAFVAMPRKTGKSALNLSENVEADLSRLRKGFSVKGWTADRLARAWLLMQLDAGDKEQYVSIIENLFPNAEMSELATLYASLPLLAYPESWKKRCAEGIRSNIGQVLDAVICNNPYPAEQLDEAAWNQLVLKAIFTGKPVLEITGLRQRRNANLAASLRDYAHERWAAHRDVNPLLWICVSPFIDSGNFSDIQRVFASADPLEREAAALACYESAFEPARRLVEQNAELKSSIQSGRMRWDHVAQQMNASAAH